MPLPAAHETLPQDVRDYGIGVVFFHPGPHDTLAAVDTLTLRAAPRADAPWVAYFILAVPGDMSWSYDVVVPAGDVEDNALEFGYEEEGLPIDSVLPDSSWARLLYGRDAAGNLLAGWAPLRSPRTDYLLWPAWLPERAQFVRPEREPRFFDSPGGRVVPFALAARDGDSSRFDYHLEPDSAVGPWLRIRVVTPSNSCGVEPPSVRDTTVWLRYLDERGRPQVWYYTRGC